jgi:protein TonB
MQSSLSSPRSTIAAPASRSGPAALGWPWLAGSLILHLGVAVLAVGLADRSKLAEPTPEPALQVDLVAAPVVADAAPSLPSAPLPVAALPDPPVTPPPEAAAPPVEPPAPDAAPPPPPTVADAAAPPEPEPPPLPRPRPAMARPAPQRPERRATVPAVAAAASVPAPSATATARPAVAAAPPADWDQLVSAWLAAHRHYPEPARRRGETGAVTLRISVAADGHVIEVTVVDAAAAQDLTEAAVGLLTGAMLPAPQSPTVRTVRIRYRLED